ncbi:hypothetical protein QQF64_009960, partial [Cirrhinus molitorella]
ATQRRCKQVHQLNINCIQGDNVSISCLTTTHPLQALTVKLRRTNQDEDILTYPDISPASGHQRWSVRKDAENVTLDLKDIRLFDGALYDCQVYKGQDCLNVIRFHLKVKECKILDTVNPTPGSSVLLPCSEHLLQNRNKQVTWQVVNGRQTTNISQYGQPNKLSSSTEKLQKPLYERARQLANGSLLIMDVVNADNLWYRCRVNDKTCYEMKLLLKEYKTFYSTTVLELLSATLLSTVITDAPATADSTVGQTEDNIYTVVMMTTIVSLCVLTSLIVGILLYFLTKERSKFNSQIELSCRTTVYYSNISG